MSRPRLLYSVPTGGHPRMGFAASMHAIRALQTKAEHGVHDWVSTSGPVHMARSRIIQVAVNGEDPHGGKQSWDYLVMHDDDLEIACPGGRSPIDAAIELMETQPDVGLYGIVYMRQAPVVPVLAMENPAHPGDICQAVCGLPEQPFDVYTIGFGFVVVRVAAARRLIELDQETDGPIASPVRFGFDRNVSGRVHEVGEDYDYCVRLRRAGYRIVADPRFPTAHIKSEGTLHYQHDDWERHCASERFPREMTFTHPPMALTGDTSTLLVARPLGYQQPDGTFRPLDSGARVVYREDVAIQSEPGSKFVTINGVQCIDVSDVRIAQAERDRQRVAERARGAA